MKKIVIFIVIFSILLLSGLVLIIYFKKKNTSDVFTFYNISNRISQKRYQDSKAFVVILKEHVSDDKGTKIGEEFLHIEGINGRTLYSKEYQQYNDYAYLYPEGVDTLNPPNHVVIDLFVENLENKKHIIEQVKTHPDVEVVGNLIPPEN